MFFKGSRYEKVKNAQITAANGRVIKYKHIRFIQETPALQQHTIVQRERLDLIAQQHYKDPLLFWRICDANHGMHPDGLTAEDQVGRKLRITQPEGIQGSPYAQ